MAALAGIDRQEAARQMQAATPPAPEPVEVLADLEPLVRLADACRERLSVIAGGLARPVVIGFDLPAVDQMARWMGIEMDADRADDFRVLESHMKRILNTGADA